MDSQNKQQKDYQSKQNPNDENISHKDQQKHKREQFQSQQKNKNIQNKESTKPFQIKNQSQYGIQRRPRLSSQMSIQDQTNAKQKQQDRKSVFVQNVDYGTTKEQLQQIFQDCGEIVRVTILKNLMTNKPKGNAYIQFSDLQAVDNAIHLSGTILRNRPIKVQQKRTNIKGMSKPTNQNNSIIGNAELLGILSKGRGPWRGATRGKPK